MRSNLHLLEIMVLSHFLGGTSLFFLGVSNVDTGKITDVTDVAVQDATAVVVVTTVALPRRSSAAPAFRAESWIHSTTKAWPRNCCW